MVGIAAGVEGRHPVSLVGLGHEVVHGRQEPILGANVGQHLDVEVGGQVQTPVAFPAFRAPGQTLAGIAAL